VSAGAGVACKTSSETPDDAVPARRRELRPPPPTPPIMADCCQRCDPAGRCIRYGDVVGLHLSQIDEADELLTSDPLALLIGMVLDQRVSEGWSGTRHLGARLSTCCFSDPGLPA